MCNVIHFGTDRENYLVTERDRRKETYQEREKIPGK